MVRRLLPTLGLVAGVAIGSHVASSAAGDEMVAVDTLASGVRSSCPDAGVDFGPPPIINGPVRSFSDDEYQRIVDLTSDARIVRTVPPAILGDPVADQRIRALAEARGYRQRQDVGSARLMWVDGRLLDPRAAAAWRTMVASARADGIRLTLHSAYRSVIRQRQIFVGKLSSRGYGASSVRSGRADGAIESILRLSSIPGYSRHHTGLAVDILSPGFSTGSFGRSAAYRWLATDNFANAKRHGFVPSYPPSAGLQGPNPEPWEFIFVGVDALTSSTRLASIERFDVAGDHVLVEGRPVASDDRLVLYDDDRMIGEVTGRCSPGGTPGGFRLDTPFDGSGDICVVQRWTTGERLLGCRS